MRLLVLGGTAFLGRHTVEAAVAHGHQVTLFNRGQRNPDLFPELEHLRGDRDGNLEALRGRNWDAVLDPSGYIPRAVRTSAELFAGNVDHYTFISSISVYADFKQPGIHETSATGRLADETVEDVTGETYGPLKVLCEQAAEQAFPGRTLVIRPGLIVGPHDPTDRFTYGPYRVAEGGEVLAPGQPDDPVQFIDVRDLAEWTVRMIEERATGAYNTTGFPEPVTIGEVLEACRRLSGSGALFTWVDEAFLIEQGVGPWIELPLWVPADMARGFFAVSSARAVAAGLTFRPLTTTVADTLDWHCSRPADLQWRAGLARDKERQVLEAWHARPTT